MNLCSMTWTINMTITAYILILFNENCKCSNTIS